MIFPAFDEGSFRDPEGRVFFYKNDVYRTLRSSSANRMKSLVELPFFPKEVDAGSLIKTKVLKSLDIFPKNFISEEYVLWHEKISPIIYPFEWTFSMLKDAALILWKTSLNMAIS